MKRGKEKEGKCKRKRKKGVEKRRKGERKILFSEGGKGIKYHFLIQKKIPLGLFLGKYFPDFKKINMVNNSETPMGTYLKLCNDLTEPGLASLNIYKEEQLCA